MFLISVRISNTSNMPDGNLWIFEKKKEKLVILELQGHLKFQRQKCPQIGENLCLSLGS